MHAHKTNGLGYVPSNPCCRPSAPRRCRQLPYTLGILQQQATTREGLRTNILTCSAPETAPTVILPPAVAEGIADEAVASRCDLRDSPKVSHNNADMVHKATVSIACRSLGRIQSYQL